MEITKYEFGTIEVDGHTYRSDVIIMPEGVIDHWRRRPAF